jgi:tape measure domain-containing protein
MAMSSGEIANLVVRLSADVNRYTAAMKGAQSTAASTAKAIESQASRIGAAFNSQAAASAGAIAALSTSTISAISNLVSSAIQKTTSLATSLVSAALTAYADLEQAQIAFTTLLGSETGGKALVRDLQQLAAQTPLTSSQLIQGAQTLLVYGIEADNLVDTLRRLGDVTGGNTEKLQRATLALGQISSVGRLLGQDLRQLTELGFNPLQQISKRTGESMLQLKKRMEAGGISAEEVALALKDATSEGGRFFGLLEKQSQTLRGLFSTLTDNLQLSLQDIGKALVEAFDLKGFIKEAITLSQSIVPAVKDVAKAIGSIGISWRQAREQLQEGTDWLKFTLISLAASVRFLLSLLQTGWKSMSAESLATTLKYAAAITGAALAVTAFVTTLATLGLSLKLINLLLTLSGLKTLILLPIWVAWKLVIISLNIALAATNLLLTATSALATATGIVTLVALFAAWAVIITTVYAAIKATVATATSLMAVFSDAGQFTKVLETGSRYFNEWKSILSDIFVIMQTDSEAAFRIMTTAGELAVSQLRDLFGPLWKYLTTASQLVFNMMATQFKQSFDEAINETLASALTKFFKFQRAVGNIPAAMWAARWIKDINEEMAASKSLREASIRLTQRSLEGLNKSFEVAESERTKALRGRLKEEIDEAKRVIPLGIAGVMEGVEAGYEVLRKDMISRARDDGQMYGDMFRDGMESSGAVDFFSAEAVTRLQRYVRMFPQAYAEGSRTREELLKGGGLSRPELEIPRPGAPPGEKKVAGEPPGAARAEGWSDPDRVALDEIRQVLLRMDNRAAAAGAAGGRVDVEPMNF